MDIAFVRFPRYGFVLPAHSCPIVSPASASGVSQRSGVSPFTLSSGECLKLFFPDLATSYHDNGLLSNKPPFDRGPPTTPGRSIDIFD